MNKVLNIGRITGYNPGGYDKNPLLFCKVTITDGKLSISGVIGPKANGDAIGGCGQIDGEFSHRDPADNDARTGKPIPTSQIEFARGWTASKWLYFLDVWDRWHLNDMRAGCEHQRLWGWDKEPIDPSRPTSDYDKFDGVMSSWNLKGWVHPPLGHLGEPCPVCGYKYGAAWLKEELPTDIVKFLEELPESEVTPAWV